MSRYQMILVLIAISFVIGSVRAADAPQNAKVASAKLHDESAVKPGETDWPWWRGPLSDAHAGASATPALTWSETENVKWKVALPGSGHASPVVWGQHLFIALADEAATTQSLICYDRNTGAQVWSTPIHKGPLVSKNAKNSHASATPVCDGKNVYTVFAIDGGLFATAVEASTGRIVWQTRLGNYESEHGLGASPVLYRSGMIVLGEHLGDGGGYIVAVDRASGQIIWRTARQKSDRNSNYGTPAVATVAGRPQLLVHGYNKVISYNPDNGEELWHVAGPAHVSGNTIVAGEKHVYASAGYPQRNLFCIAADGKGDVTQTHITWQDNKSVAYVPSSLLHEGRLYTVNDQGIATCYNAATGAVAWRERLEGPFTASLIVAGGRLYISNERGKTYVLKLGDQFEILAQNQLPGAQLATPIFCGNVVYIRTDSMLYCIGNPNAVAVK